jgi:programmed cell death 6-interacting protein
MFSDDLMILDRLRTEAVNVQEPHVSGISRLVTYAAQLKWLGGKFPVDVSAQLKNGIAKKAIAVVCDVC